MVAREEHTVLGRNRMASGQEAFKACAVSFGSNQEGSVLLAVFPYLGLALIALLTYLLAS